MPNILELLISERDKVERAIVALTGHVKRRGRPRKIPVVVAPLAEAPAKKPPAISEDLKRYDAMRAEKTSHRRRRWTPEQRKQQSRRVKAHWRKVRKAA